MTAGHRVLLVDDDPHVRAYVEGLLRAAGFGTRIASTVEEALAAVPEEAFCLAIVDQQLPARAGEQAFVSGGEHVMTAIRARDDRRNDDGRHVTPIVVITGYLIESDADRDRIAEFLAHMFDLGADAVVEKPLDAKNTEKLLAKIRTALERAGRRDHGACAGFAAVPGAPIAPPANAAPAASPPVRARLVLDGWTQGQSTGFLVNGRRAVLQNARFVVFLRLVVAKMREPGAWKAHEDLGKHSVADRVSRIRVAFRGLVDEDLDVVQSDRGGAVRLHPAIAIESVNWEALEKHEDAAVQKIARDSRESR